MIAMRRFGCAILSLVLAASSWSGAAPAWAQEAPDPNLPGPLRDVGFEQRLGEWVPADLEFTDSEGRPVRLGDYYGDKPVVVALVYYECPMLCSMVLNGLISSLRVLTFDAGTDFEVVVVSFDPEEDHYLAAAKKRGYVEEYDRPGGADGLHFLVGEPASIDALTEAVGFSYVYDEEKDEYAHASGVTVLTPEGQISRYLFGIEYAPKDMRLALVESAAHKVGTFVDQLLLFCYNYDPATGKYGAATMNLIRLGGVLTVGGILLFIWISRRRDRQQAGLAARGLSS